MTAALVMFLQSGMLVNHYSEHHPLLLQLPPLAVDVASVTAPRLPLVLWAAFAALTRHLPWRGAGPRRHSTSVYGGWLVNSALAAQQRRHVVLFFEPRAGGAAPDVVPRWRGICPPSLRAAGGRSLRETGGAATALLPRR